MDGIMYYVAATGADGNVKEGATHSPDENSAMGRLIVICDTIGMLDGTSAGAESGIEKEIACLIKELRK